MRFTLKIATATAALMVISAPAIAATVTHTDSTFRAIDNAYDYIDFTFDEAEFGGNHAITSVGISVTFDKCDGEATVSGCSGSGTPYFNEIGFALVAPDGTTVSLINNNVDDLGFAEMPASIFQIGSASKENITITFDDAGLAFGSEPESGTFAPYDALSGLAGVSGSGLWRFFYEDDVIGDALGVRSVSLTLTTADPVQQIDPPILVEAADVPAPAALGLLGIGLAGLGMRRKAR